MRYARILPTLWTGETGRRLRGDTEAQIVALYLMTSPHANMLGVYYLPLAYLAHDTGLPSEGALKGLQRLIEEGFCSYEGASEVVYVRKFAEYQTGASLKRADNRVKSIREAVVELRHLPYVADFIRDYADAYHLRDLLNDEGGPAPRKGLRRGFEGASKPESESETESETESEPAAPAGPVGGLAGLDKCQDNQSPQTAPRQELPPAPRTEPPPIEQPNPPLKTPQTAAQAEPAPPAPGGLDLDAMPDYAELRGSQVEEAMARAGLLSHVGMGAAGLGRLLELLPIRAWELRRGMAAAQAKGGGGAMRSAAGYVASVIRGLRESGEAPPPRSTPPPQERPPGPVGTVDRELAIARNRWRQLVADTGYPADKGRVERWAQTGPPGDDDEAMLREHRGDWASYDAAVEAEREEARSAIAAALGG